MRRFLALLLLAALLLTLPGAACAEEAPFALTLHVGTGSILVRARLDSYDNNLYLSLSDLSAALSGTDRQFCFALTRTAQDGDIFTITTGQPAAAPTAAVEGAARRVDTLYTFRNRLQLDGREQKYYTCRDGADLYMSLTDIQLLLDLTVERSADGSLRLLPGQRFLPNMQELSFDGFFEAVNALLLADAETGQVYYALGSGRSLPIASLSKLMVYLLLAEDINAGRFGLDDAVPISENAAALSLLPDAQVILEAGTALPFTELLDAMLLASSNECALALAEYCEGSEAAFVERMNRRAAELGLTSAVFYSVHGLPVYTASAVPAKRQNSMSADDLFRLCAYLLKSYPALTERTARQFAELPSLDYITANSNPLVFNLPGVNGLKTGSTNRAGYCLAASLPLRTQEEHCLVAIVLGAETPAIRNQVAHILLRFGQDQLLKAG